MIPYGRQDINKEDIKEVVNVLKSDFLTQGPKVPMFENIVKDYVGANYSIAVNSATSALHIACLSLGLSKGDILWTSPNTFVASANCGIYCGAKVDFVDINKRTYNLCPVELKKKLIKAKANNCLPKILVVVHFAGQSCDMRKIHDMSQEYGFRIIEDASHAIGGKYLDHQIGSCKYSDITVFSFHPVKIITTAEGGIATTNNLNLSIKMNLLRSHGISRDPLMMTQEPEGPWYYQQLDLGMNYRMTDIQAALGISQMRRLDEFVKYRHKLQERYDQLLAGLPIIIPHQSSKSYSALHLYPIQFLTNKLNKTRASIFNELRSNDIGVNVHYIPVHTQPFYEKMGFKMGDYPNSEEYYERAISIPLFSGMTFDQQDTVVRIIKDIIL